MIFRSAGGIVAGSMELALDIADRLGVARLRRRAVAPLAGRVLEIGAGSGRNFPHYRRATHVTAIEPDPAMRRIAAEAARRAPLPIEVVDARAEELPFLDGSFDGAAITLVLCSVARVPATLAELRRVLRPGAPVRLVEHVRHRLRSVAAMQAALTPMQRRLAGNCHLDRDTLAGLRAAGFTIEGVRSHLDGLLLEIAARSPS